MMDLNIAPSRNPHTLATDEPTNRNITPSRVVASPGDCCDPRQEAFDALASRCVAQGHVQSLGQLDPRAARCGQALARQLFREARANPEVLAMTASQRQEFFLNRCRGSIVLVGVYAGIVALTTLLEQWKTLQNAS